MKNMVKNRISRRFLSFLSKHIVYLKPKKSMLVAGAVISLIFCPENAAAALFSQLTESGSTIFEGMKMIIYAVAGFGIVGVAIGGFFGNLNWKWLSAIIIGLLVIAMTAGILMYMTESDIKDSAISIQDSLINAD